jgi:hypothetical protein
MKRLVILGLLLAAVACTSQPPPPAATAPPPQVAAVPPAPPLPPPPPPTTRTSFNGLYKGMITAGEARTTSELTGGNCDPDLPINMRVKRGDVRIWYKDFRGHTLHYRGRLNPDGTVETSHTNQGGGGAAFAMQISGDQATGNLQRGQCWYQVTMSRA